jgi:fatty acid desaturase
VSEEDRFAAIERAETRLEAHARQRGEWRERRARWRAIRAWVLALLVLPAGAAAGFVVVLEMAGGDLGRWSPPAAAAFVVVAFVGPAALSGAFGRVLGRWEAFAVAACTLLIEIALVCGVAFVALGYGPRRAHRRRRCVTRCSPSARGRSRKPVKPCRPGRHPALDGEGCRGLAFCSPPEPRLT